MDHHLNSYVKRNNLPMKGAGWDPIGMPIVWQNVKLPTLKKHWSDK